MKSEGHPSSVLYATLKSCGISNRDAAALLLDAHSPFAGRDIDAVLNNKPLLSRRIVHAAPGSIPTSCFEDFTASVPKLATRVLERYSVDHCKGDLQVATRVLVDDELAQGHANMTKALGEHGANAASYQEAPARIEQFNLPDTHGLTTLHLMALVVAGCTADGQQALANVAAYALDELDAEANTAKTGVFVATLEEGAEQASPTTFGIVRVRDGVIAAGSDFHSIGADGLVIGMLPREEPAATDVDHDVSLRHAKLGLEDDKLFIADLSSTNGTSVISPSTGKTTIVALPEDLRDKVPAQAVELHYGDFICLGATTRYIVLPGIAPDSVQDE